MLQAVIEPETRAIMQEQLTNWGVDTVYCPTSGTFIIERTLRRAGLKFHSNSQGLLATQMGNFLSGQAVKVAFNENGEREVPWLSEFLDSDEDRLATLMLAESVLQFVGYDTPYHKRMLEGSRRQFPTLHAKTVERLAGIELSLESFQSAADTEWLRNSVPQNAAVVAFPDDIGKQAVKSDKLLSVAFDVEELRPVEAPELMREMRTKENWFYATRTRDEERDENLVGVVKTRARSETKYVYSSTGSTRLVAPSLKIEPVPNPKLGPGESIADSIQLAILSAAQFEHLRAEFLNPMIATATATVAVAVLSEGRILGVIAATKGKFDPDEIYLLSDFAVNCSDYKHLSKLVVLAACSKEFQLIMQRTYSRRFRTLSTTAFTKRPVSMKYRGILNLAKRTETTGGDFKYELQYSGTLGQFTLKEAVAEWRKRGWDEKMDA